MRGVLERPANETLAASLPGPAQWQPQSSQWKAQTSVEDVSSVLLPAELVPTVIQIAELVNLPMNWNSYGAVPVAMAAMVRTLRLLGSLQWRGPLPAVVPTSSGGIQLAWGGDDDAVEVTIPPHGPIGVLIDVGGNMTEVEVETTVDPSFATALSLAVRLA